MQQQASVAIDIGNLRAARCSRCKAGVISENAGLAIKFASVDDFGPNGAVHGGEFPRLTGLVVGQRKRVPDRPGWAGVILLHGFCHNGLLQSC